MVIWPDTKAIRRAEQGESFALLRDEQSYRRDELPQAADFHRLPLSLHQSRASKLRAEAQTRGVDGGLLLTNRWNISYATGLMYIPTERPLACFLPTDEDDAVIWMHPYLDTELIRSWWCTEAHSYFDFPHAEEGFPSHQQLGQLKTVNLYRWWGDTLNEIGYGNRVIGTDHNSMPELGLMSGWEMRPTYDFYAGEPVEPHRPVNGSAAELAAAMPEASFLDISDLLIQQRACKSKSETQLAQRALDYLSEIHAFAREYFLQRGPGALDWEIASTARSWGMQRVMQDIRASTKPHETAGIDLWLMCRSGIATAYPHPNQLFWNRIEHGQAFQIAAILTLGGYGGELYRSYLVAPWNKWQETVWEVHSRSYEIQAEQSYVGNTCSEVARAVHRYQIQNNCARLIYHRPGHGQGPEGHQPPYHSLGDHTVLRAGMHFSNEPGLYDIENGFGFNHGNTILVTDTRGLQMGTAPVSKEWCFLRF